MTAQTPIARASAPADGVSAATAVLRALRRIRVPQTQRNRELALLLFALVLNVGAVILVDLGTGRAIDTQAFVYGGLPRSSRSSSTSCFACAPATPTRSSSPSPRSSRGSARTEERRVGKECGNKCRARW